MLFILICLFIYLLLGLFTLSYWVLRSQDGGFIIQMWWFVILFYPYILVKTIFKSYK
ncbi:hypothetical protein KLEB273_gp096 [Bacillus phage vB_BauM_KLEB27-3]|nr:hypothetical protein KLEB273_gp096 [Bacillus phage vB_BauM_KLEB27-3]